MVDDIRPRPEPAPNKPSEDFIAPAPSPNDEPTGIEPIANREEGFVLSNDNSSSKPQAQKPWQRPLNWWRKASTKERIIAAAIVATILFVSGGAIYALTKKDPPPPAPQPVVVEKKVEAPKNTEPSRLTGVEIPLATNKRPVVAIQIENSPDARPQAGLKDAGIVFEAIAEGGITRFNAMYLEGQPNYIGPVRSIRPYYIDFFLPFDAALAHAGGSGEGLAKLTALGVKDLDYTKANAFHRASDRYAPHNLYTSMAELDRVSKEKGFTKSTFKSWPRKKEKKGQPIKVKSIDFAISSPLYNVHYDYDPVANNYHRSMGGRPHTDHRSGQLIKPKVIVALVMSYSKNGIYSVYQTTGSGEMFVFQDGQLQKGTWKKAGPKDQFQFIAADGKPLALNPGQTWVNILRSPAEITHTP